MAGESQLGGSKRCWERLPRQTKELKGESESGRNPGSSRDLTHMPRPSLSIPQELVPCRHILSPGADSVSRNVVSDRGSGDALPKCLCINLEDRCITWVQRESQKQRCHQASDRMLCTAGSAFRCLRHFSDSTKSIKLCSLNSGN